MVLKKCTLCNFYVCQCGEINVTTFPALTSETNTSNSYCSSAYTLNKTCTDNFVSS